MSTSLNEAIVDAVESDLCRDRTSSDRAQLHWPDRAKYLDDAEIHLSTARGLARALWHAVQSEDVLLDERDAEAFRQLVAAIADQLSAANLAFRIERQKRESAK
ncbi:hypothetical protein [Methylocystis parvus]|uniref:Uncharacterized protein n=2 Tax=Methylocystis parvus TaxID=134 RepID=A0A6B8M5V8_9HYPH|nr:hypothetical protein [Methylocystis parvus]QGM97806.1 hypothetical protein F7D14_10220 [Methylocystis parvus]WBK01886.1 hypothetical protein MMG94_09360 [Methylocystis parvus OBBP]